MDSPTFFFFFFAFLVAFHLYFSCLKIIGLFINNDWYRSTLNGFSVSDGSFRLFVQYTKNSNLQFVVAHIRVSYINEETWFLLRN